MKKMMCIEENSLDDIVRSLLIKIKDDGTKQKNSKGENTEILGVYVKLTNPLNRISLSFEKQIFVSPLGEFFWYMSGSNNLDFIKYYIPKYKDFSNDNMTLNGAYGARLFDNGNISESQVHKIVKLLKNKNSTRQAVIQIFDKKDLDIEDNLDIPCTCTLQFFIRNNKLILFVTMRSNDVFIGLPHDIFCFTMLQEMIARELNIELGNYHHFVSSCHFYKKDEKKINRYLKEGFQSSITQMDKMPNTTTFEIFNIVQKAEVDIRNQIEFDIELLNLDTYWKDILYILKIFSIKEKYQNSELKIRIFELLKMVGNVNYKKYLIEKYRLNEK
ncbi:thymidylate synthase [Kaistella yonginensis]|uniref:thymidylate synthase n=1 Tax=Kaistella yonginensis TaxID=658267 RepID=UPI0025B4A09D|nr:thymidylate synthase [Kaistella yonginensis]MDN3607698.1 thymidylate synthase [Kaistella yonginensis]